MESGLSQEVVVRFLVEAGGKVENSKLLLNFRNELEQTDPQLRKEARELFKTFINKVAVVREEGGVKYVVLKKKMQHLVAAQQECASVPAGPQRPRATEGLGKVESLGNLLEAGEAPQEPAARRYSAPSALSPSEGRSLATAPCRPQFGSREGSQDALTSTKPGGWVSQPQESLAQVQRARPGNSGSLEQLAEKQRFISENPRLENCDPTCEGLSSERISAPASPGLKSSAVTAGGDVFASDIVPERLDTLPAPEDNLCFEQKIGNYETKSSDVTARVGPKMGSMPKPKPYMYPLCLPPDIQKCVSVPSEKKKGAPDVQVKENCPTGLGDQDVHKVPKMKRSQPADGSSSPHLKRISRVLKFSEDARFSDQVPLDPVEHEWIVKTALGHWTQVSGLLLKDSYLAERKDFMSGFTAVHWAAKFGNSEIMCWIIDNSEKNGIKMDVNTKSHGGYTPLHIAAIHGRENIIIELVTKYDALTTLRDYSGKRPYHYLAKDSSFTVRRLLGDPEAFISESTSHKCGSKVASSILSGTNALLGALADDVIFQEFSKSLKKQTNLSKFFTAPAGHKKRAKVRTNFTSLNEEPEEEREEVVLKRRPVTEIFF